MIGRIRRTDCPIGVRTKIDGQRMEFARTRGTKPYVADSSVGLVFFVAVLLQSRMSRIGCRERISREKTLVG